MSDKKPWKIEYPDLEYVNINDPEIQKDLIRKGVAVGVPGATLIFTQPVLLVAGGKKQDV